MNDGNGLDRLNQLLKKENLGIPDFRRVVGLNASNLKWLRKVLPGKGASEELMHLLGFDIPSLLSTPRLLSPVTIDTAVHPHESVEPMQESA